MEETQALVLSALHAAQRVNDDQPLEPDQVLALGQLFGLSDAVTTRLVEAWQETGLATLAWGGKVTLTDKGKAKAEGKAVDAPAVHLAEGAVYVGGNVGSGAVIGQGAMGAGAVHIEAPVIGELGELAAALAGLPALATGQSEDNRAAVEALHSAGKELMAEAQAPVPDQGRLKRAWEHANALLENLTKTIEHTEKLYPVLVRTGKALGTLAAWAATVMP